MSKINFQFHALPDEIVDVIKKLVYKEKLFIVTIQLFPNFISELIKEEDLKEKLDIIKSSRMIVLYDYKPDVSIKDYDDFLNKNMDGLIFEIGLQKENTLKESRISTITFKSETLKLWKKAVKEFKSTLLKGSWVVNPNNGAKEYYRDHCYSVAAKKAFEEGMKIIPFAGCTHYILSDRI